MSKNDLGLNEKLETVQEYQFEKPPHLIKGLPELWWQGKRPFTSTQYFPAQEKEQHGDEVNGWLNKIFWGDNIQVMSHLLKDFRNSINLIYIDPPFDSKADYKKTIELRGQKVTNDHTNFEDKQYTDIWNNSDYLQFMYERLIICRELLADTGYLFVHCDWHKSHLLRCILDEVFGSSRFCNEIIWQYSGWNKKLKNAFEKRHDTIFMYCFDEEGRQFNSYFEKWASEEEYIKRRKQKPLVDADGRRYVLSDAGGGRRIKRYLDEAIKEGVVIDDVWNLDKLNNSAKEGLNYPTQKPEALLERIIKASSNSGDIVFDCFMGSGTTQAVAMKLGRRFIGADINLGAIQTTTKRLINVAKEIGEQLPNAEEPKYTGFTVYNVNNYDVFRNPVQAKEVLSQWLELQPLPGNTVYDGMQDEWLVKIMPVNRIATKVDLNDILSNFDVKAATKFADEHPSSVYQKIRLVCMGHEPDLAATLKAEIEKLGAKIEVEIKDILRDKSGLTFKRDSEAKIVRKGKKLVIKNFYPMNLLEKLSLQKTNVEDWRELVESVMIDFNYDGAVLTPSVTDIPEKNELVKGEYEIPDNAGVIRVKITDLLSESLEMEVK